MDQLQHSTVHLSSRGAMRRRSFLAHLIIAGLFVASGANCRTWTRGVTEPRTLPPSATLDQVVTSVNDNAARVHSLQSTQASLTVPGAPTSLRASVAMERERRLRLTALSMFGAQELDLGSNDEIFWLWVRLQQPQATFVCRHDQFAFSNARQIMPVEPEWLIDAIGLPRFDVGQPLEGPTPVGNGRLQIRSRQRSSLGDLTKDTIVDEWNGAVVEQHLYDPQGRLLASAITSRHKRDPVSGAALPRAIDIRWPTTGMSFHLDVSDWRVNALGPDSLALFTKPEFPGFPEVNLADPNVQFFQPGSPTAPMSPGLAPPPGAIPAAVAPPSIGPSSLPPVAPVPNTPALPTTLTPATPAAAGQFLPR